ncbi:hypothetical protein RHAL1_00489 [Beijerinckiaceae bacterium RH AL1]|nr:hypothetical protein RHAL8_00464 [Beijerinckiaceae bacterium RH AL8]VVB43000.1 hypothetical protein RHCH11_RHCH11_00466 [Beijerinckiaceae bacterium RH CH11]VVC53608.1 hypothetical protein RHAL1_00489 [Beijerinckiaceae bacterium RH AL1]
MTQERPSGRDTEPDDGSAASPVAPGPAGHAPEALASLKLAMRRARFDDAERLGAMADMRAARIGRLELLAEALQPLVLQIPEDVDLFDFGLMPGLNPRLFLDMIGFVEMGRDARTYRLIQDTRYGRKVIIESDSVPRMVEAATDYVARRLLERDKALAAEVGDTPVDAGQGKRERKALKPKESTRDGRMARLGHALGIAFAMLIDLLGAIAFFGILFAFGWFIWQRFHGLA